MADTMAGKLRLAAERLRERDDELLRAVADLLDEEREELEHGDPYYQHRSALRVADEALRVVR